MRSNGPPSNYCGVLKKYLITHVLSRKNGGSIISFAIICDKNGEIISQLTRHLTHFKKWRILKFLEILGINFLRAN